MMLWWTSKLRETPQVIGHTWQLPHIIVDVDGGEQIITLKRATTITTTTSARLGPQA